MIAPRAFRFNATRRLNRGPGAKRSITNVMQSVSLVETICSFAKPNKKHREFK
jgi:hypothetical protein